MNRLIDFSSRFRILKGGKISLVVSAFLGGAIIANAAPSGGVVTSGNANISQSGNVTNINQSSQKASINWNDFSIKSNETVNFNQPNVNSITLNRVVGTEKSVIDGALNANGQVWILNSNGVLFNKNAKVNTSGLVATTAQLSDADFQAGNYEFKNSSSNSVINVGTIEVQNGGSVVLASNEVQNSGTIKAVRGKVHLVGADSYSLNLNGNSLVNLTVNKGVLDALVKNSGNIIANGGEIYLTTNAVNELLKGVVNNTGVIEANSLDEITGKVELFAHGGTAEISGNINAVDGFIETSGDKVKISDDFRVKADKWLIDPTDFTIAASSGDITGATLSSNLGGASIEIQSVNGATDGNGDIFVNDAISWGAATKLTLNAQNDIFINESITATNANGQLALYYGQGAVASGNTADYYVNAPVNLKAGDNFFTKFGSNGAITTWKVITALGSAGSTTGTDLQGINGNLTGNYVLGANINASATSNWNFGDHDGDTGEFTAEVPMGWMTIGGKFSYFTGNFDGLGHTVDKLSINRPTEHFIGLFGKAQEATIKNIGVTNVNMIGRDSTGGLVGEMVTSTVSNSYSTGSLVGRRSVGGLVGKMVTSTVSNSYSNVSIASGESGGGGLVGSSAMNSYINNSYASGTVIGADTLGGLVGYNGESIISNSYALGNVEGENSIGGLVGDNVEQSRISNSYASGNIKGKYQVGGLAGECNNTGYVLNSYALGSVEGESAVGGLVGYITGGSKIEYSYAIGKVTHSTTTNIGGLVGYKHSNAIINGSFYNKTVNSTAMGDTSYGKTTEQLQTFSTFKNAGWSIIEDATLDTSYKYPILNIENGTSTWIMYQAATPLTYILSDVLTGYIYNGESQLPTTWTAESIFGSTYSSWVLGTDYNLIYNTNSITGFTNAGTYNGITIDILKDGFTEASSGNTVGKFIISPKAISAITGITATNREYNGLISAALNYDSAVFSGMIDGDSLTASATGEFEDKNAGENKTVNISSITLGGTDAGNYTLDSTTATTTANITKKALIITNTTAQNKTYDGTTTANVTKTETTALSGKVDGDDVIFDLETLAFTADFSDKNVADNKTISLNVSAGLSGTDLGNYSFNVDSTANIIAKAISAITGITATSKEYDGLTSATLDNTNASFTGMISGDNLSINSATGEFVDKNAGENKTVNISSIVLGGTDAGNYTLDSTSSTGTGTISKKALTIIGTTAQNREYDGTTNVTENLGTLSGFIGTETVTTTAVGTFDSKNAGTRTATFIYTLADGENGGLASNYSLSNSTDDAEISKINATVTANSDTKTYNGLSQSVNQFTATGLVNGETISVLDGVSVNGAGTNVGTYIVTLSGSDENYNLIFVDGKLTIQKANAIIIANSDSVTYNGQTQRVNGYTISGLVNGETDTVIDSITGATISGKNAGEYTTTLTGTDGNYNLTFVDGKLIINKANAIVTANSNTVTYNGQTQTVSGFTATGLVADETGSVLSGISGATASGKNAGEYITTLSGTDENYNLTFINGKLTITPKQITVSANDLSKIFGDNDPILTYIAQGIIENDTLDGLIQRASGENAGEYTISKGTLANQNYNITFNNGIFTIKRDTTLDNAINSIANTTAVQIPKVEIIVPKIVVAPQTQTIVISSTGNQVNVMSQPIQNQNTTMVTMGELRANQDTNTQNGNSDIRVPVGDNSVIELINGGVNLPDGVEQQFFVVNTENNNI